MYTRVGMTAAIILFASLIATAQPETPAGTQQDKEMMDAQGKRGPMAHGEGFNQQMMKELNLTEQQKTELRALRAEMEKSMVKTQADIKTARIDLRQLLLADKPDRGAIEKKLKEISGYQHEAKIGLLNHLFSVNAKLTPEQQKKFREHMAMRLTDDMGPMPMGGRGGMMQHRMGQ